MRALSPLRDIAIRHRPCHASSVLCVDGGTKSFKTPKTDMLSNPVGPRHLLARHPIRAGLLLRRHILSAAVQAKSMARVARDGIRGRTSLGRS